MRKISKCMIIFCILIVTASTFIYANNIEEEENIENILKNEAIQTSSNLSEEPTINARHSIVIERGTNMVLYGKKEQEQCKMASTTKIMTAIIVIENCNDLNQTVIVSQKAARNWWLKVRACYK